MVHLFVLSSDLSLQDLAADAEAKSSVIQELSSAVAKADSLVARVTELEAAATQRQAELEEAQRTTRDLRGEVEQARLNEAQAVHELRGMFFLVCFSVRREYIIQI